MTDLNLTSVYGPKYEIVLTSDSGAVPLVLNVGTHFNTAEQTSTGTLDVTVTAAEIVNAYRAIGYDGLFTQLTEESLSNYAGVTRTATVIGNTINAVRIGLLEEQAWTWTPNAPIFISNDGVLTQNLPTGFVRRIGWAISATKINLDPYPIITGV